METFCCFKQKEVINICDGFRFGYVNDLVIDLSCGKITDIIIPVQTKNGLFFSKDKEYIFFSSLFPQLKKIIV